MAWPSASGITVAAFSIVFLSSSAFAQVTTSITSSGLNTQVSTPVALPSGQTQVNITGGTRPSNGVNLFHSFGEFSIGSNSIGNFLNETGLPTSNILSRVTGGNPSSIFGTLQTTGFGNANLFLINPAGVIFGPSATLNVGGALHVTTADYAKLADGARFNVVPGAQDALLSAAPVSAFGFLGPNSPSAIVVRGSRLEVAEGQTLSLVGGNTVFADPENPAAMVNPGVTLDGGSVSAPGGRINLVRVGQTTNLPGGGEIALTPSGVSTGMTGVGSIIVSGGQETTVAMNETGPSAVRIRGGQLVMTDWPLELHSKPEGQSLGVDIALEESAEFGKTRILTQGWPVAVDAGPINIRAPRVLLNESTFETRVLMGNNASGGDITLSANQIVFRDSSINANIGFCCAIFQGSLVTLQGMNGTNSKANVITLSNSAIRVGGEGGDLQIFGRTMDMKTSILNGLQVEGNRGAPISMHVDTLTLKEGSSIQTGGHPRSLHSVHPVTIVATDSVKLHSSTISTMAQGRGQGGDITITTPNLSLSEGARIESNTLHGGMANPGGSAGNITLNLERLSVTGGSQIDNGTGVARDFTVNPGSGGAITVQGLGGGGTAAKSVEVSGEGSGLLSEANSQGPSGTVNINSKTISVSDGGAISVSTSGTDVAATAGTVMLNANEIVLSNGASVRADSSGPADAGSITINSGNNIQLNKAQVSAEAQGSGRAGTVRLDAGNNLTLNKASISVEHGASGVAGSVQLKAGNNIIINKSELTADSPEGSAGSVELDAGNRRIINGSTITPNATIGQ